MTEVTAHFYQKKQSKLGSLGQKPTFKQDKVTGYKND